MVQLAVNMVVMVLLLVDFGGDGVGGSEAGGIGATSRRLWWWFS